MGLMGLLMACYGGLRGILSGLTKSTNHPSGACRTTNATNLVTVSNTSSRPHNVLGNVTESYMAVCVNWGSLFSVSLDRALVFGAYIRAPDFQMVRDLFGCQRKP